jgi:hypothetical protein
MDMSMCIRTVCRAPTNHYYDKPLPPLPYCGAFNIETELVPELLFSRPTILPDLHTLDFIKHVADTFTSVITTQYFFLHVFTVNTSGLCTQLSIFTKALSCSYLLLSIDYMVHAHLFTRTTAKTTTQEESQSHS